MRINMFKTILLLALLGILFGCSDQEQAAPKSEDIAQALPIDGFHVLETFDVGDGVYVRSLALDSKDNALWVGTSLGVLEIDTQTKNMRNTYTREQGLANEYVFGMLVDSDGGKWFGTNGGGVSHFKDNKWTTFFPMHGLADYWIYSFIEDQNKQIWVGTWNGLNVIDPQTGKIKTYLKELVNEWVYGLDVDSKGTIWIGTEGGVNAFNGESWEVWTHEDGLGAPNSTKLPISENTGLGTRSRHDLSVMSMGLETYNPNYVFTLAVDQKDHVWVGTWGGGIARFDGERWTNYTEADGLAGNVIYSVSVGPKGDVWAGTNKGLSRFDGQQWSSMNQSAGLLDNNVYAITVGNDGLVWVGTHKGVTLLGPN